MQPVWERLTQPFSADAVTWRVLEVMETDAVADTAVVDTAADIPGGAARARVRPQLSYTTVLERLNEVVQPSGWSNRYVALGNDALSCELSIESVTKTEVALPNEKLSADEVAHDAFVYAAELFGMVPPMDAETVYWVDYDPEAKTILHEPAAEVVPEAAEVLTPPSTPKPAGQQAIDRLVERLKGEGRGLEVAKLINTYGGYGQDKDAARELYSQLRALLLTEEPTDSAS